MKEAIFILFVVFLLLGLTAIRYRKQIAGMIGLAKMLKEAKSSPAVARTQRRSEQKSVQLVSCSKCGIWVPEGKAVRRRDGMLYCANCA